MEIRKRGNLKIINFRATEKEREIIKDMAHKRSMTVADYFRWLVMEDMKRIELEQLAKSVTEI